MNNQQILNHRPSQKISIKNIKEEENTSEKKTINIK
jgi:hypothetical protein